MVNRVHAVLCPAAWGGGRALNSNYMQPPTVTCRLIRSRQRLPVLLPSPLTYVRIAWMPLLDEPQLPRQRNEAPGIECRPRCLESSLFVPQTGSATSQTVYNILVSNTYRHQDSAGALHIRQVLNRTTARKSLSFHDSNPTQFPGFI